eukprot:NODE_198_length_1657_cov_1045.016169_g136_i0.p1 GENE.NODE_198_length_1657_cov_1045.016169_g136_i0~~NODE_198_length_1657_cov_1045.016169_g136_i0.p1  ORF type:complete len:407 (+),score=200.23 NODE_198_length_1657_cov_1045.016169_g136_i0:82-1302(+)
MSIRPLVTVRGAGEEAATSLPLPSVYNTPVRVDLVQFVHSKMALNKRQPYAVNRRAGHKTSAESWGTGRAVARIPRVSGGGTHRSGQGAFGNMCRGGRMFAPTKTWRKWNRKVNVKVRRYALRAAIAGSGIPALVMARGHNIEQVPEIPLVVPDSVEAIQKTKDAAKLLKSVGLEADCLKVKRAIKLRCGHGKARNRRKVVRRGPMIVVSKRCEAQKAFRNIPGVSIMNVKHMNLLKLAPGGYVGRMLVWTQSSFRQLAKMRAYHPEQCVDSKKVINSEEVQCCLRAKQPKAVKRHKRSEKIVLNPAEAIEARKARRQSRVTAELRKDPKYVAAQKNMKRNALKLWKLKMLGKATRKGEKRTPPAKGTKCKPANPTKSAKKDKKTARKARKATKEAARVAKRAAKK